MGTEGVSVGYDAFISYSHAADGQLAPRLQDALQRLAKPWYRRRALRVFRDDTGLSANPGLWTSISEALDDSEHFILMASPQAAGSEWVNREVEQWLATKSSATILPVLTEGEWLWDPAANDFDWAASDAVPRALAGAFVEEPRHVDLRWARNEVELNLRHSRFRDQVAQLAAPLHGRSKDELEGDDIRQHRRTMRIAWAAASALVLFTTAAVASAVLAIGYANEAVTQRSLAQENEALAIANQRQAEENAAQAEANAKEAADNAAEAAENARQAIRNAEAADRNAEEARTNLALAEENAAEAQRNLKLAEDNAAEAASNQAQAEREATRAQQQERLAQLEADRARAAEAEAEAALAAEQVALAAERDAREAEQIALGHAQASLTAEQAARLAESEAREEAEAALLAEQQALAAEEIARAEAEAQRDLAEEQARLATSSALGATSVQGWWSSLFLTSEDDLDQRLLLAVEAFRTATTPTAINGLHTLTRVIENGVVGFQHIRTDPDEIAFLADLDVSQDGSTTVVADQVGNLYVWRADPYPVKQLPGAGEQVIDLTVGPSGSWLLTRGATAGVTLWNLSTGASQHLAGSETIPAPQGRHVAVIDGTTVRFVDLADGSSVTVTGAMNDQPFSPDGRFAIGRTGGDLVLWDLDADGAPTVVGAAGDLISFNRSATGLVVADDTPSVVVFDVVPAGVTPVTAMALWDTPRAVALSADRSEVAAAAGDYIAAMPVTGGFSWAIGGFAGIPIDLVEYSQSDVSTAWRSGPVSLFLQPSTGKWVWTETQGGYWFDADQDSVFVAHVDRVDGAGTNIYQMHVVDLDAAGIADERPVGLTFVRTRTSPDGRYIATAGAVQLWDTHDPNVSPADLPSGPGTIDLEFDGEHRLIGAGVRPHTVEYDVRTPLRIRSVAGFPAGGEPLRSDVDWSLPSAISPSGTVYAIASGSNLQLRRLSDASLVSTVPLGATVTAVEFSPTGEHAVVTLDGVTSRRVVAVVATPVVIGTVPGAPAAFSADGATVAVFDGGAQEVDLFALSASSVTPVGTVDTAALTAAGDRFALAGDGSALAGIDLDATIVLWEARTGAVLAQVDQERPLQGTGATVDVALSPDGGTLAAKLTDGRVQIWDRTSSGLAFHGLLAERLTSVVDILFSPDGRLLGTTPHVTLWDVQALSPVGPTLSSDIPGGGRTAVFSTDSRYLTTRSADGVLRYLIDEEMLAQRACDVVRRNLTADEWERLVPLGEHRATCPEWPLAG